MAQSKRHYKHRTASTKSKTYQDYLAVRAKLESKGIPLKDKMKEYEFLAKYKALQRQKRKGLISSQPWQELQSREKAISTKQMRNLKISAKMLFAKGELSLPEYIKNGKVKSLTNADIYDILTKTGGNKSPIYEYIQKQKKSGLFGGKYE